MTPDAQQTGLTTKAVLRVRDLSKTYASRAWRGRKQAAVHALDQVSLEVPQGGTLGLVGESGSGKSTLALCIARLEEADAGEVWLQDRDLLALRGKELRTARREVQVIFQDSALALNPHLTSLEAVREPLDIEGRLSKAQRNEQALVCMRQVGLGEELASRSTLQVSGGQRQRLAIARALMVSPALLVLDEAFSGLDLLVQAQILELLAELQASRKLTYLLITHDMALVGAMAREVAVMQAGRIVEQGDAQQIFGRPQHPHTKALLAAMPRPHRRIGGKE